MFRIFGCNFNGGQFIPRRGCWVVLTWVSDAKWDMCQFLEVDGGLRVVDAGDGLAPKDEISVNEGTVGREKFECDDVIITTVLSLGYE